MGTGRLFSPTQPIMIIYNQHGEPRQVSDIEAATRLIQLKEKHGSDVWPVVEECLRIWIAKKPQEYKSFLLDLKDMRETRSNKYASSKTEMFRYTLDIPETVVYMLRKLYTTSELPMDKKFFRTWARKFPKMRVAEKI
jgi:hypothetical protein